jgi:hypothetical protein
VTELPAEVAAAIAPAPAEAPDEAEAPARANNSEDAQESEKSEDPEKSGEPEETPYDFDALQRMNRRDLRWALPGALASAAFGSYLGYLAVPGLSRTHPSVVQNLKTGGMVLGGLGFIILTLFTVIALWPPPVFGPHRAPRPLPLWLGVVKIIGIWLVMIPFSEICLLLVGIGIDSAVNGSWIQALIRIAIGLVFGAAACVLLAGSGSLRGEEIKPGGKLPEKVRQSPWWRRVRLMLTLWALLFTGLAIFSGVAGHWDDFWDALGTAFGSWIAVLFAAAGTMPDDAFSA